MFTAEERNRLRTQLLERGGSDGRIAGVAITGSAAAAREDVWSDIDLAFVVETEFRAMGPECKLVSGSARTAMPVAGPATGYLIGFGWLYALHARSSIARGKLWQAEYMISGMGIRHCRWRVCAMDCRLRWGADWMDCRVMCRGHSRIHWCAGSMRRNWRGRMWRRCVC